LPTHLTRVAKGGSGFDSRRGWQYRKVVTRERPPALEALPSIDDWYRLRAPRSTRTGSDASHSFAHRWRRGRVWRLVVPLLRAGGVRFEVYQSPLVPRGVIRAGIVLRARRDSCRNRLRRAAEVD